MSFDKTKLCACGDNVDIHDTAIIKRPELASIGNNVRICAFTEITSAIEFGDHIEIVTGTTIKGGGGARKFVMEGYSSLAKGVSIWLATNDYRNGLVTHSVDGVEEVTGDIVMEKYTGVGSHSVIMPGVVFREGSRVGALSFVPPDMVLEPWTIYAGTPVHKIGEVNRESVLAPLGEK